MKKLIGILSLVFLLGTATIVSAAAGQNIPYGTTTMYSGVYVYSDYKANTTNKAAVSVAYSSVDNVTAQTRSTIGHVSNSELVSTGSTKSFTNVFGYQGEQCRLTLIKTGINGTHSINGLYYYDGGF